MLYLDGIRRPSSAMPTKSEWIPIVAAVLSLFSALGVAYLALRGKEVETDVKREEIALQQTRFDADQRKLSQDLLLILVPKLLSEDEREAREGMLTLRVLLPDRVEDVRQALATSLTPQEYATIRPGLPEVSTGPASRPGWVIVAGGDRDLPGARHEVSRAARLGYTATVYLRDDWYRTALGPYPTERDAQRASIDVRARLRSDAYVVDLARYCPHPHYRSTDGYLVCEGG